MITKLQIADNHCTIFYFNGYGGNYGNSYCYQAIVNFFPKRIIQHIQLKTGSRFFQLPDKNILDPDNKTTSNRNLGRRGSQ